MSEFKLGDIRVKLLDKGFLLSIYDKHYPISYGDITCCYLDNRPPAFLVHPVAKKGKGTIKWKVNSPALSDSEREGAKKLTDAISELQKTAASLTEWKKTLMEPFTVNDTIVTDRDKFEKRLSGWLPFSAPNTFIATYVYDKELRKPIQILTIRDWKDLLIYDLCKVYENNILIKICGHCGTHFHSKHPNAKYCPDHQTEGAKRTKYNNLTGDRCAKLAKLIYNRLYRSETYHAQEIRTYDCFADENKTLKQSYKDGVITEQEYYDWLVTKDEETRRRKNNNGIR